MKKELTIEERLDCLEKELNDLKSGVKEFLIEFKKSSFNEIRITKEDFLKSLNR